MSMGIRESCPLAKSSAPHRVKRSSDDAALRCVARMPTATAADPVGRSGGRGTVQTPRNVDDPSASFREMANVIPFAS
jgi:hypothetical protein